MRFTRGSTVETERRGREVQLLLNVIEPDPEYQASIFSDVACVLDVTSNAALAQRRLESYLGCSIPDMLRMPLWKLVDAIFDRFPGWPEEALRH